MRHDENGHRSLSQEEQLLIELDNFDSAPKINDKVKNCPLKPEFGVPSFKGSYRMNKNKKMANFKSGFRL